MTERHLSYRERRDSVPAGRCVACEQEITDPRRQSSCSKECAAFINFVVGSSAQRKRVYRRDRGVCSICGVDSIRQRRIKYLAGRRRIALGLRGKRWALPKGWGEWEMDHIVPICQGGGPSWDLSIKEMMTNLRTLCLDCHTKDTRAVNAALRARRKVAQRP